MKPVIVCAVLLLRVFSSSAVRSASNRCICPEVFQPVCGVDGVTYENTCRLACEDIRLHYTGECSARDGSLNERHTRCACPVVYDPVCGVDHNTYNNACFAGCAEIKISHKGECNIDNMNCKCPSIYEPVCGYDGVTYHNICDLSCEGVQLHYMGPCRDRITGSMNHLIGKCTCSSSTYEPVCGKDKHTYSNQCFMECARVKLEHKGECKPELKDQFCKCPAMYRPVCGIDGITYNNACFLMCSKVLLNHTGACNTAHNIQHYDINEVCSCSSLYEPTCGVDGNTYRNICFLTCARVDLEHKGECNTPKCNESCHCPGIYQPVCGDNRVTYRNTCCLTCANVLLSHVGPC